MTDKKFKRESKDVRRKQFLDEGLKRLLANSSHSDECSTVEVSKAIGMSQPSLLYHFHSKEQFFCEVMEHAFNENSNAYYQIIRREEMDESSFIHDYLEGDSF